MRLWVHSIDPLENLISYKKNSLVITDASLMRLKTKSMIYVLLVHPQHVLRSSHTINDESYINWLEK